MKLKYLQTIVYPSTGLESRIPAFAYSPNGKKFAVGTADRRIILVDDKLQQRDNFSTKPVDAKYGKKSYALKALAFSPDSIKLAVGQTDNIVFIYRLGEGWEDKKVISNKFTQSSSVMALLWPDENRLVIGLVDGKVRSGSSSSNKCSTLYKTGSMVVALAQHPNGKSFVSGHADGSIVHHTFEGKAQTKICVHTTAPYCLAYSSFALLVAGADRRIVSYTEQGRLLQNFDHGKDENEKEFTAVILDATGRNAVFGSFGRFRLLTWNQRRGAWDEGTPLVLENFHTVTALAWRPDGTTIVAGSLLGAVVAIDCCLKKALLKNTFETIYVTHAQVVIRDINIAERQCVVRSKKNYPITDIKVMGRNNGYVVAYTAYSMLLADIDNNLCSEIAWDWGGNEKFYVENDHVCMIINAGEVTFVEYGKDEVAGWIRTERVNPHQISVCLYERSRMIGTSLTPREAGAADSVVKRVAYLLDARTIALVDLGITSNRHLAQISHTSPVDWLELNDAGNKLLYRDTRSALFIYLFATAKTMNMINYCSYVQWVPQSDVVVAQSNDKLCIWYNTDNVEQVSQFPIKGDVESVLRDDSKTEVIVLENNAKEAYELDSTMIEFGTALDALNLNRALVYLENSERNAPSQDLSAMWKRLADVALENGELLLAQRCYAGLNDFSRVLYVHDTLEKAEKFGDEGLNNFEVRARLAMMGRDFKAAERIYLENNALPAAIDMYLQIGKWETAIELATAMNYNDLENLKGKYYRYLQDTGREDKAAEIRVKEGDPRSGLELYLRSNRPAMAAKLLMNEPALLHDHALAERVSLALVKGELFDTAGELFGRLGQSQRAVECYRRANAFAKAVAVARSAFPEQVVPLEEEWAQWLYSEGKFDAAINHFLESGTTANVVKAVDCAIRAKDFEKALEILKVLDGADTDTGPLYERLAKHYEAEGVYNRAERLYIDAGRPMDAVEMYNKANRWVDAFNLASEFFGSSDSKALYLEKADALEQAGRLKDAEELYVAIGEANRAILMYKNSDHAEDVMRLVERFHADDASEMRRRLADELERSGNLKAAEEQYLLNGDWLAAVNMYKEAEQWADAHRIAKSEGDEISMKQVAYLWAKSLGGEAAVKLLVRHNLLEAAIDFGIMKGDFDFAFELCRLGATRRLPMVQQKFAEHLEGVSDFDRAEEFYLKAGLVKEAVLMHVHNQNWEAAERVANAHLPEMLAEVYLAEAKLALEVQNAKKAESCLLRASRPDIILAYYRETAMWEDALRVAKEYLPEMLEQCQNDYEEAQLKMGGKGVQSSLAQAKEWERQNEYKRAVECYLKVDETATSDAQLIAQAYYKAGELVSKFLAGAQAEETLMRIGSKLVAVKSYVRAGEIFLLAKAPQQAIEALIAAQEWGKAKRVAEEMAPELEERIDHAYAEYLKNQGRVGDLIDVDLLGAIDLLVEKGEWGKALLTAKQQNHRPLLDKYLMMRVSELMGADQYEDALKLLVEYGVAGNQSSFNTYKRIIDQLINSADASYGILAELRTMLLDLNRQIAQGVGEHSPVDPLIAEIFGRYLYVLHLYALHNALSTAASDSTTARRLRLHIMVSMVRNVDLLRPDKVFYEAGIACKECGGEEYTNMAFVFLNQYLDIVDAIEDGDASIVDNSIFEGTDIPLHYSLPQSRFLADEEHEEAREWVLAASVGEDVRKELKLDSRGCYEASIIDSDGNHYPICAISGYPVIGDAVQLGSGIVATQWAWNALNNLARSHSSDELIDCRDFLSKWCGREHLY